MLIFTARVTRTRVIAAFAALIVICGAIAIAVNLDRSNSIGVAAATVPTKVSTNEDRISYLESCGWRVTTEPLAVEELLIPDAFDETYAEYLALQQSQGFDLTKYCGKRVKRFTYEITNYPTGEAGVQASLLIYKNQVVGGEVLSPRLDGFIHGLTKPT